MNEIENIKEFFEELSQHPDFGNLKVIDFKSKGLGGTTPLHLAAAWGLDSIIEQLLGESLEILNCQDIDGYTALHKAVVNGKTSSLGILLKNGADYNLKDVDGCTPFRLSEVLGLEEVTDVIRHHFSPV